MKLLSQLKDFFSGATIKARTARGGLWLGGATSLGQALRLLRRVVLARILLKEDFGLMALVMATVAAFEAFTEVGVRACVIQNKNGLDSDFLNAAWWSSTLRGLGLCLAAFLLAPVMAGYYDRPDLLPLLRLASLVMLFRGIVSPRLYAFEKEMYYGRVAAITQGAGAVAVAATIVLALHLRNVWALAIGLVFEAVAVVVLSFLIGPFRPKMAVNWGCVKAISKYAKGMLGLPVLMMVAAQAPVLVLGKFSVGALGIYDQAAALAAIPLTLFNAAILRLMLPAFSQVQDDMKRFKRMVLLSMKIVVVLGAPVTAFLVVFSGQLMSVAFGREYEAGGPALAILGLFTLATMVNANLSNVFFAKAAPGLYRNYSFIRVAVLVAVLLPAVRFFGMIGAALSVLVALLVVIPIQTSGLSCPRLSKSSTGTSILWARMRGVRHLANVGNLDTLGATSLGLLLGALTLALSLGARAIVPAGPRIQIGMGLVIAAAAVAVGVRKLSASISRSP